MNGAMLKNKANWTAFKHDSVPALPFSEGL